MAKSVKAYYLAVHVPLTAKGTVSKEIGGHRYRKASVLAFRIFLQVVALNECVMRPHCADAESSSYAQSRLCGSGTAGRETGPSLVGT